jgi:hypothetical protein
MEKQTFVLPNESSILNCRFVFVEQYVFYGEPNHTLANQQKYKNAILAPPPS